MSNLLEALINFLTAALLIIAIVGALVTTELAISGEVRLLGYDTTEGRILQKALLAVFGFGLTVLLLLVSFR